MPYITTALNHTQQYTLQATAATGSCACTIVWIKSTGATASETVTNWNAVRSIPNGAVRMVFVTSVQSGATGTFQIIQNANTLANIGLGGTAPVDLTVQIEVT